MGPRYYCYRVIHKMRHERTLENMLCRREVLFSVSPTHAGGRSWPCLLFVSCDNSINTHNKDIFPFGKIIKSQEQSRCLPGTTLAARGWDKQDVGCSQHTNELQRGNKCSNQRDQPAPDALRKCFGSCSSEGNLKSRPSAAARDPARGPAFVFLPRSQQYCRFGLSIPWHPNFHCSSFAEGLNSFMDPSSE